MNKIRKIEETRDGNTRILERNAYNEEGRLVRSIDEGDQVRLFEYSADGRQIMEYINGNLLTQTLLDANNQIIKRVSFWNGTRITETRIQEDGVEIREVKESGKLISRRILKRNPDGRIVSDHEEVTGVELKSEYLDQNSEYARQIHIYKNGVLSETRYFDRERRLVLALFPNGQSYRNYFLGDETISVYTKISGEFSYAARMKGSKELGRVTNLAELQALGIAMNFPEYPIK
jgi:YD repeat-containing protein